MISLSSLKNLSNLVMKDNLVKEHDTETFSQKIKKLIMGKI